MKQNVANFEPGVAQSRPARGAWIETGSRREFYEANTDIIDKIQIIATLDIRTSPICQYLDGQIYNVDKCPMPPYHYNCRSTTVPVISDPAFDFLEEGATRVAKDEHGETKIVDGYMTYYDWLKEQPREFVESVIGERRAELLLSGEISAERFRELQLDKTFKPRTLAEMRALEPEVFERVFPESPLSIGEKHGLTKDETGSILQYVSSDAYKINEKLRNGTPLDDNDKDFVENLDSALNKMPGYNGVVYRSLQIENADEFVRGYVEGKPYNFDSYLSSGTKVYDERFPVQYVINSRHGKDIRAFNKEESEILFRRNTKFLIDSVDGYTIYMTEI